MLSETTTSSVWVSGSFVSCPSVFEYDWYIVTLGNISTGEGGCSSIVVGNAATVVTGKKLNQFIRWLIA